MKESLYCVPAVVGTTFCGDGIVNGSEECDPNGGPACPNGGGCSNDCQCHFEEACCYLETVVPSAGCIGTQGDTSHVSGFLANCAGLTNPLPGVVFITPASGPCGNGPVTGLPCTSFTSKLSTGGSY